jgi:PAS domain S-box-containing protein
MSDSLNFHGEIPPLQDLLSLKILRDLEDTLGGLAGIPVCICDTVMDPLFMRDRPPFCRALEKAAPGTCRACALNAQNQEAGRPVPRSCPAGLHILTLPVEREGNRYGMLLLGPVRTGPGDADAAGRYAGAHGLAPEVLKDQASELPLVEPARFERVAELMATFANAVSDLFMGSLSHMWEQRLLERRVEEVEVERKRSEVLLESVLESMPAVISAVDREGNFLTWPKCNEDFFGYTADEVIAKLGPGDFMADPDGMARLERALAEKGHFDGEVVLVKKDGTHVLTRSRIIVQFDEEGRPGGFIGLAMDISEQKELEQRIRTSEERTRTLIENLPDIFYQTDLKGKITYVNESGVKFMGYSNRDEVMGMDMALDFYVDSSERKNFLERLQKEEGVVKDFVVQIWRGDGSKVWVSAHSRYRRDENGNVIGVEGVARDVTDRIEGEKRLASKMEELERAYDRLKQAQTQLIRTEKMASLGALIAGIAHEINNPVNFFHGNLDYLDRQLGVMAGYMQTQGGEGPGAELLDDIREALADAKRGATRVKEIVDTLRSFSRATSKRKREPIYVHGCITESLRLVEPGFRNRVSVKTELDESLKVEGDRGLLSQVCMNLLLNAFQASGDGGSVSAEAFRSGNDAVIRIRDSGPGVPEDIRDKIFEPFFSAKEDGVGLGLSLSYDIVQGHGGEISVESEEGKGAVFEVRLPLAPPGGKT